jgi:hypothetical protein
VSTLFIASFLLSGVGLLHAQTTVTIGTGTLTSSYFPVAMYYWHSNSEALYTSADLTGGGWGGGPGAITNLRWNVATAGGWAPLAGNYVSIYIEETSATTMTTGAPSTAGTLVWTGPNPLFNATGWWNFTLTNPFCYSGGNIIVRVVRYDFGYGSPYPYFYYSTTATNQHRHAHADTNPPTSLTATTDRPNIQMVIAPNTTHTYSSSVATQNNTAPTGTGMQNQEILGMQVVTSGSECFSSVSATSFLLNTAGSTSAADITGAKIYYTGTSSTFSAVNQFGSTVTNPSGAFSITGSRTLLTGTNYFWLTYDIAPGATNGNLADAQCNSITVGGTPNTPSVTNPAGSRTILTTLSGIYTIDPSGSGPRNYTTFTAAVAALTSAGISGPVTFNVAAATYNETFTIPAIPTASATNTITFDGGVGNAATRIITYAVTATYGRVITLDGADYVRFKNLTINSTGTYGYGFLFTNSADYNEISNCVINMPATTTSAYHIGICASTLTSYSAYGAHGSYNLIQNNTINSGTYGIRWNGSGSTDYTLSRGNQFIGNALTNWYTYGMYLYYSGAIVVKSNSAVQRTAGTFTTTSGYAYYIYYPNDGPDISYNYGYAAYGAFYLYYLNNAYASTANRARVFNNMGVVNGTSTVYGLYVNYGKYNDVAYNSIRTTNTTGTAYGIYSYGFSTNYETKIQNNMLSHSGTGTYYPIYNYYSTSHSAFDYNRHYRTGAGTDNYLWNNTSYATFAAMKAAVSGFHQNSDVCDPEWVGPTNLHSNAGDAYQTGTPISGITDDYDGDARHATTPCIGADEFVAAPMVYGSMTCTQTNTTNVPAGFDNQEVIGIEVAVTGASAQLVATSFLCNITGTTNASSITTAKIYYTGKSSTFAATTLVGSYASPTGSFTITGNQALRGPGTNYFWLVYDVAASAVPGTYIDGQCTSVTLTGTPRIPTVTDPPGNRMIIPTMSGVYTIDPMGSGSRNFINFTTAIAALQVGGIGGAVTFNVAAAVYTEQITIPPIGGTTAVRTITFDGGAGNAASRIITYSVATAYQSVITLNGADYLKFKNLTVNSTNASYGYCFLFTAGADYNELSNCVLNVPANTTSTYHIPLVASSTTSSTAYGNWANYNLIKDNTLNSGYYAVTWQGTSGSLTSNVNNEFSGNTIQDFYVYGIYSYYSSGLYIHHNRIIQRTSGTFTTSSGYAIYNYYPYNAPKYIGNYLKAAYAPMYVVYANSVTSSTANRGKCINNMLIAEGTSTQYGLYFNYPQYSDIGFNSVYTKTTGTVYGLYEYGTSTAYDNKIANNYIVHEGAGTWYPVYSYYVTDISQYDNNAYYRIGTGTDNYCWNYSVTSAYPTLAALKAAAPGFHQNSVVGNPYYISTTDLHSRSHVGFQTGIAFAGVTDDYDGDTRLATPCIGADEYPQPPLENDLALDDVMIDNAIGEWSHREGAADHAVKVVLDNVGLSINPTSVTITYKVGSAPVDVNDGVQETFIPGWVGRKATLEFTQKMTGLVAGTTPVVYAKVFWASDEDNTNDVSMDDAYIEIAKVHGIENFQKMDAMTFPFTRDPGYLDLPWKRLNNNGGSTLEVSAGLGNGGGQGLGMNAPTETADEWIITPGADLESGASYRFGFDFRNWGGAPVTIEAAFGDTPDPTQMTVFATFANIAPGGFLTAKQLAGGLDPYFNTPTYAGTRYVALHFITSGTNAYFSVDNIKLDDNPSPPPKIAFGLPGAALSTFIDDPTYTISVVTNYKQPGIINRTYEVQSKTNIYGMNGDFLWDVETSTPWLKVTKAVPNPTLQNYNFIPPRPRQFQTFTLSVDPSGLAAGVYLGSITFYGILFNDDFPPPANGLNATNQPLIIRVELRVTSAGSKGGPLALVGTVPGPLTVPGSPYYFTDGQTGDPIATLQVTSGQIASMTIRCYPNQLPQNLARMLYVQRYWQISHTGTGWTADITFPYADQEAAMILDRLQLRGVRQPTTLSAWEDPIMGTTSVSDLLTNSVRVSNLNPTNIVGNIALAHRYMIAGKDGGTVIPTLFSLEQNYPNPFNPSTRIVFNVAEERSVRIAVYNSLGVEVSELVNEVLPAGRYEVAFDASALPSGTYLCRMLAGEFVATQRMTLSK